MAKSRFSQIPGLGKPEDQDEMSMGDRAMDLLDRPGRATRAGISAAQNDKDIFPAIKEQLMGGQERPDAPTGADIASKLSDDTGLENPYALAGIATAADVLDPSMAIPGGAPLKAAGMLGTMARMAPKTQKALNVGKKMYKAGDIEFPSINPEQAKKVMEALQSQGRVKKGTALQDLGKSMEVAPGNSEKQLLKKLMSGK
jgi:hypothetical protein